MIKAAAIASAEKPTAAPASAKTGAKSAVARFPGGAALQCKCACGAAAGAGGSCDDCARKKKLQRKAAEGEARRQQRSRDDARYEVEADRVADRVLAIAATDAAVRPAPAIAPPAIQRRRNHDDEIAEDAPPEVESVLAHAGEPLGHALRDYFEPRFGHDFSRVRVHVDDAAVDAVQARAFTVGHHLVFRSNEFRPGTEAGRRLLAHELTHVVQQGAAGASAPASANVLARKAANLLQRKPKPPYSGTVLSKEEIDADPARKQLRAQSGQASARVCRDINKDADTNNCPAPLAPGDRVNVTAENSQGLWLVVENTGFSGLGPGERCNVLGAFVKADEPKKETPKPRKSVLELLTDPSATPAPAPTPKLNLDGLKIKALKGGQSAWQDPDTAALIQGLGGDEAVQKWFSGERKPTGTFVITLPGNSQSDLAKQLARLREDEPFLYPPWADIQIAPTFNLFTPGQNTFTVTVDPDPQQTAKVQAENRAPIAVGLLSVLFAPDTDADVVDPKDPALALRASGILARFSAMGEADRTAFCDTYQHSVHSWEELDDTLTKFIERSKQKAEAAQAKQEREQELGAREQAVAKLYGLEALYAQYQKWADYNPENLFFSRPESLDKEFHENLKANGFNSVEEFRAAIGNYIKVFRNETVRLAFRTLTSYDQVLAKEAQRYTKQSEVAGLHAKLAPLRDELPQAAASSKIYNTYVEQQKGPAGVPDVISGERITKDQADAALADAQEHDEAAKSSVQALADEYPVLHEEGLPINRRLDKIAMAQADANQLRTLLQTHIAARRGDIGNSLTLLGHEPDRIFGLDNLMARSFEAQGIGPNSIFRQIVQEHATSIKAHEMAGDLLFGIFVIALALVSGGTGLLAAGASLASAGISTYMAIDQLQKYMEGQATYGAGLSTDDPSPLWVVVAVVGAGLDLAAAAKAVRALAPAANALEAGSSTVIEFKSAAEALVKDGQVDAKAAREVTEAAVTRTKAASAGDSLLRSLGSESAKASLTDPAAYQDLVRLAFYRNKEMGYAFEKFALEVQESRKAAGLAEMGADELAAMKRAWSEGKSFKSEQEMLQSVEGGTHGIAAEEKPVATASADDGKAMDAILDHPNADAAKQLEPVVGRDLAEHAAEVHPPTSPENLYEVPLEGDHVAVKKLDGTWCVHSTEVCNVHVPENIEKQINENADKLFEELGRELGLSKGTKAGGKGRVDIASAVADAKQAGFVGAAGEPVGVDLVVQPHSAATETRGALGVSGKDVQSAHHGPTAALKEVEGYDRESALTVLLPRATHKAFDDTWKAWSIAQVQGGAKQVRVDRFVEIVDRAIQQTPNIDAKTKNAMSWVLFNEVYKDLGLLPSDLIRLPYSKP